MPLPIRYTATNVSNSVRLGNIALGVNAVDYGPSTSTGWAGGVSVSTDGYDGEYAIHYLSGTTPRVRKADTFNLTQVAGQILGTFTYASTPEALSALAAAGCTVINTTAPPNIVTSGLAFNLNAGLIMSYPRTNTTWYDVSGNGYNGTLNNGPTFDSTTNSIYFDASDDYMSSTPSNYGITNQFTIEVLCYPTQQVNGMFNFVGSNGSDRGIMAHWPWSSDYGYLDITNTAGGFFRWYKSSAGIQNVRALYQFILYPSGQVVVKQNNKVMVPDGTDTFSGTVSLGNTNTIGAFGSNGYLPWGGYMNLFRVYNRALTDTELSQNYYQGNIVTSGLVFATDAGNLVSYMGSGTTTYSLTGSFIGSLINGTSYNSGYGGTFNFDGTNDYIQVPYDSYWNSNVFGTATNFTISCWAKANSFKNWDTLITKCDFDNIGGWYSGGEGASIWANADGFQGVFSSGVAGNPGGSAILISYTTSNTQKWFNLCFTGDGTTLRFYVDGVEVGTGLVADRYYSVSVTANGPSFGERASWNGQMTNMMFYTRALTPQEINQNFNAYKNRFNL